MAQSPRIIARFLRYFDLRSPQHKTEDVVKPIEKLPPEQQIAVLSADSLAEPVTMARCYRHRGAFPYPFLCVPSYKPDPPRRRYSISFLFFFKSQECLRPPAR